jgi:hypothetical protein
MEDEFVRRRRRINSPVAQRPKAHVPSAQLLNDGHQMRHRPAEAIQTPDQEGIARV